MITYTVPELLPGDILVQVNNGKGPFDVIKRWAMGCPYEHVFLYLSSFHLRRRCVELLCESSGRGVAVQQLSNRYEREVVVMRSRQYLSLPTEIYSRLINKVISEAIKLASEPKAYYDYYCIVRFVLPRLLVEKVPFLAPFIPVRWQRNQVHVCSEAIWEIYHRAGYTLMPGDMVPMPGDFVDHAPELYEVGRGWLGVDG